MRVYVSSAQYNEAKGVRGRKQNMIVMTISFLLLLLLGFAGFSFIFYVWFFGKQTRPLLLRQADLPRHALWAQLQFAFLGVFCVLFITLLHALTAPELPPVHSWV